MPSALTVTVTVALEGLGRVLLRAEHSAAGRWSEDGEGRHGKWQLMVAHSVSSTGEGAAAITSQILGNRYFPPSRKTLRLHVSHL